VSPELALSLIVNPTLGYLGTLGVGSDDRARVLLLAIGLQESAFQYRRQVPVAHAMGFWQFERGGGVAGVLAHRMTWRPARDVCDDLEVQAEAKAVWEALAYCDALACAFARLLLWTDPKPLPGVDEVDGAWQTYLRNWRPGKPRPGHWPGNWRRALEAVNPKGKV
jgi:hypothetical protein